jgi:hypothetical protein
MLLFQTRVSEKTSSRLLVNTTKGLEQDWSFARCACLAPLLY